MATQIQHRRGTTSGHATFTGASGEVTVDTDLDIAIVHDGSTAGGFPLVNTSSAQTLIKPLLVLFLIREYLVQVLKMRTLCPLILPLI